MRMPIEMPTRPRFPDGPVYVFGALASEIVPQQDPLRCAACCMGRSGFGACVARCLVTGEACDSGTRNCSRC